MSVLGKAGPIHGNGTRQFAKPPGGHRDKPPWQADDSALTSYVTNPGIVCRPGNKVVLDGQELQVQWEWWFPPPSNSKLVDRAIALCSLCPVREPCRALAEAANEQWGVWGGVLFEKPPGRPKGSPNPGTPLYDDKTGRRVS